MEDMEKNAGAGIKAPRSHALPVLAGLLAVLLLAHQLLGLPGDNRFYQELRNAAHTPWFFLITLLLWYFLRHIRRLPFRRALGVCALTCTALAAFTELVQLFTARDASLGDIGLDLLGSASALLLASALECRPSRRSWALLGLAAVVFLAGFGAVGQTLWRYQQRAALAPVLLDPQGPAVLLGSARGAWRLATAPLDWPGYAGRQVLEIRLEESRRYPGITLREPYPDWNAWRVLVIDAYVGDAEPVPVTIRVETERDRGMGTIVEEFLRPGHNRLEIPVAQLVEKGPDGLPPVRNLLIFSPDAQGGRHYYLGSIRLE